MANSWIDHLLCSPVIDGLVGNVEAREDYVSSDHKPLTAVFNNLANNNSITPAMSTIDDRSGSSVLIDWPRADEMSILNYQIVLGGMLCNLEIPTIAYNECAVAEGVHAEIDRYYDCFMSYTKSASLVTVSPC